MKRSQGGHRARVVLLPLIEDLAAVEIGGGVLRIDLERLVEGLERGVAEGVHKDRLNRR
jgi:hypothetical protein